MRIIAVLVIVMATLVACDDARIFDKNVDLEQRAWMVNYKPEFEFNIDDTSINYNIYCNIRNTLSYPYSRLFVTYYLQDSIGLVLDKKLIQYSLFDQKTGKPFGSSGLGDIYDHRIPVLTNHRFQHKGVHKIKFEQFMRTDTLDGILAVGARIERVLPAE
jgi:gliding motility-associated lipoprotein GldH